MPLHRPPWGSFWKEARHPSRFDSEQIATAFRELGTLAFQQGAPPPDRTVRVYRAVGPTEDCARDGMDDCPDELGLFIRRAFLKQSDVSTPRPARVYTAGLGPASVLATYAFESEIAVDPR